MVVRWITINKIRALKCTRGVRKTRNDMWKQTETHVSTQVPTLRCTNEIEVQVYLGVRWNMFSVISWYLGK